MSEICELTELSEDSCAHCKAKLPRPVFTAKYESICHCGIRIDPGEKVVWTLDGTTAEHVRHAR